jgi:predicted nucleic acid-binding protein
MSEALFIDTSIIMYAVGAEHPYRQPCQKSLTKIVNEKVYALVSSEIHQEILHRYLSLGLPDKARQVSVKLETLIPVTLAVTLADIHQSRTLIEAYPKLQSRDLIHVAVMLNHGISRILSTDVHFDQVREIERIDPQTFSDEVLTALPGSQY